MTDADAWAELERLLWPDGPVCPHCASTSASFLPCHDPASRRGSQRRVWKCLKSGGGCGRQFSVLTGTVYHRSRIDPPTLVAIVRDGLGEGVRAPARRFGIDEQTVMRLRDKIASHPGS